MSVEDKDCKMSLAVEWILQSLAKDHEDEIISVVKKLGLSIITRFSLETAAAMMADANMSYQALVSIWPILAAPHSVAIA